MPRKRKAAREYRQPNLSVREQIRRRFAPPDSLDFLMLMVGDFFKELPTEPERVAFRELFPAKFYDLFECEASVFDQYPASAIHVGGSCVFRRKDFVQWLSEHPAVVPFRPPDISGVPFKERQPTLAAARAAWWRENEWPCDTDQESYWLAFDKARPAEWGTTKPAEPLAMPTTVELSQERRERLIRERGKSK